jgi:hypothetical protein
MGNAFLAEQKLSFRMKLFHFVCEKRLLNWLRISNCSRSHEHHFHGMLSEAAPPEHLKIYEKHAPRKSLIQRVDQGEAPFLKKSLRKTWFPENSAPGRNLRRKCTWTDAVKKRLFMQTILKLKINLIQNTLNFLSIQ